MVNEITAGITPSVWPTTETKLSIAILGTGKDATERISRYIEDTLKEKPINVEWTKDCAIADWVILAISTPIKNCLTLAHALTIFSSRNKNSNLLYFDTSVIDEDLKNSAIAAYSPAIGKVLNTLKELPELMGAAFNVNYASLLSKIYKANPNLMSISDIYEMIPPSSTSGDAYKDVYVFLLRRYQDAKKQQDEDKAQAEAYNKEVDETPESMRAFMADMFPDDERFKGDVGAYNKEIEKNLKAFNDYMSD